MQHIILIGLNHNTAPVELRERIAFSAQEIENALISLQEKDIIKEVILFSTCNRVEVLITSADTDKAETILKKFISEFKNIPMDDFTDSLYLYNNQEAVKHIFMVSSGLDSMILGEPQILGQIKDSYRYAVDGKTSGVILNRLIHKAFFTAKKIRTETGIGAHAVSISYAAVELAKKIFGSLLDKTLLLIGAGEMAELAVEHLISNRVSNIYVANRTFKNGIELAKRFNGKALKLEEISKALEFVDIVIGSTGAKEFVIKKQDVKNVIRLRKNRPIFFIDIAVPRNIDPEVNKLPNSYLYDIDDLKDVIDENKETRNKEAVKAERIIDEAVINFWQWYERLDINPTITALKRKIESIAETELNKTVSSLKHLSPQDCKALSIMLSSFTNKILHDPILFLKNNGCKQDKTLYLDFTKKLFNLDQQINDHLIDQINDQANDKIDDQIKINNGKTLS